MKKLFFSFSVILTTICFMGGILVSCDGSSGKNSSPPILNIDSIHKNKEQQEEIVAEPIINYKVDSIFNVAHRDSLLDRYSENEQRVILLLNRIERNRIHPGGKLVIPDTIIEDFLKYSPFPENLPLLDSIPKTLLIAQRIQAFALYENGRLVRWGPVSSGKQSTPTPNGLHYANYKSKRKISTVNSDWIMPYYYNFMNFYGVGVHQYLLPGYPASHACVRLDMEDAKFIYEWAVPWKLDSRGRYLVKNGTPFMVFGEYNFERQVPWLDLVKDPNTNNLNTQEIETIKNFVMTYMSDERNFVKDIRIQETFVGG